MSSTFQVDPEQKKTCGNESHAKEIKHIHASADNLLHIRIKNLDWRKCGTFKNESREIDCPCCSGVDAMLIALTKISGAREVSPHPAFMGNCPTISPMC